MAWMEMGAQCSAPSKPSPLGTMVKPWSSSALPPGTAAGVHSNPQSPSGFAPGGGMGSPGETPSSEAVQDT